jgi:putative spermidine/putrescine transport system permease protein
MRSLDLDLRASDDPAPKRLAGKIASFGRSEQVRAAALIAPLLIFLLLVFIGPVVKLLSLGVIDNDVGRSMPLTIRSLEGWSAGMPIPAGTYEALADELAGAGIVDAATRLNYAEPGMRALVMSARRQIKSAHASSPDARSAFLGLSPQWGEPRTEYSLPPPGARSKLRPSLRFLRSCSGFRLPISCQRRAGR